MITKRIHDGTSASTGQQWQSSPQLAGANLRQGQGHDIDLKVPISGTIPRDAEGRASLTLKGDAAFEKSRRAAFVVLAIEAGVPLPDVQKIVGHTTADMTMQYFNPTKTHAAERIRRQLSGTVLNARPIKPALTPPADIPAAVWAILTDEQKLMLTQQHFPHCPALLYLIQYRHFDYEKRENIKKLLLTTPDHGIVCAPYLIKQGFSHDNLKQYVQRGYLDSVGRGAYCKHGSSPSFAAALAAATEQLTIPLHLGGWSALAQHGLLHFLPAVERPETLYSQPNVRIPAWMLNGFKGRFTSRQTNFLPAQLAVDDAVVDGFRIPVSSQERAILEYILEVPDEHPVSEVFQIMEMMLNARAPVLQELLERCSSIKVKRMFFLLAEDLNLSWYEDLDPSRIDLGSGNRVIDKDGTYRRKWLLTVRDWRNI